MKPLPRTWTSAIRSNVHVTLFADFDGTLAPIVLSPTHARSDARSQKLLGRLIHERRCTVVVISGRALIDLKRRLRVRGCVLVGSHGLEISGGAIPPAAPMLSARRFVRSLRVMERVARKRLKPVAGAMVESKRFGFAIHHRCVHRRDLTQFCQILNGLKEMWKKRPFEWRDGKKVDEIRPRLKWNKGTAARHVLKHTKGAFPIAIGDDTTDEDMFGAFARSGVTIRVGRRKGSAARYFIRSQAGVAGVLKALLEKLKNP